MIRWSVRIAGVLMLLLFVFLFANLQKRLAAIQRANGDAAQTSTSTR